MRKVPETEPVGRAGRKNRSCVFAAAAICVGLPSAAWTAGQIAQNPPSAVIERAGSGAGPITILSEAPTVPTVGGEAFWSATIQYVNGKIFNPRTGMYDKVRLRSYQGEGVDPDYPFVAPTISLFPGETFRITLDNKLPADDPSCTAEHENPNIPHCFNSTNLHAHGLWVSPAGNSDNVLLRINPDVQFQYEYNIPADHPAGTYWYHPHLHGSTALQVSSGMAGALIIKGTRLPTADQPGDVDTLLRRDDGTPFPERIVLLQQIPYACRDAAGRIKTDPPSAANGVWVCDEGDVGEIERYVGPVKPDQFGPPAWHDSGRYTTINGRTIPTFTGASAGGIERWRLIHAGVRASISLGFQKTRPTQVAMAEAAAYTAATPQARAAFVDQVCDGTNIVQHALAEDGHTRDRLVGQQTATLHPGYREDLLVVFPTPGIYCIVDGDLPGDGTASQQAKSRQLLGFVEVGEGSGTGGVDTEAYLKQELKAAAARFMPGDVSQKVIDDLEQGLLLSAFEPHKTIAPEELTGKQSVAFKIDTSVAPPIFEIGSLDGSGGGVDLRPYDPMRVDRLLPLGGVEEWRVKSLFAGHPFHIHVNPFQIVEILDGDKDVSGFEPGNSSPYARLKGVWKDTLYISGADLTFVLRTRYQRYIGDFVLHCHILDHEDQGMMQNVRIALPDGHGGIAASHH
ncbi:multicopper oxidase family protein [Mesorhizobium sp. AR10]|uniref:multicopper oxidase family protein n=1 Tax=Mesorhizobium sp. AR10 TaxID=2865839 RepID=UPI0029E7D968|nr:multicopper oxidase family protein [Mesorhizobium sp. AR10]